MKMYFVITEKENMQPNAKNNKQGKNAVYCATSFAMEM